MTASDPVIEICQVEGDDQLHDYGGGHGNKGNDFARFWLINELIKLGEAGATDYLFILEYVQDVAQFNDSRAPSEITLYQLKKKESASWDLNALGGLTKTRTVVQVDSPLAKLLRSVLSFKKLAAKGEFVSNARFNVDLAAGGKALALDYLSLDELATLRQTHIRDSAAAQHGITPSEVPLDRVTLRYVPIAIDDLRVHVIGAAHGFLKTLSGAHAAQADSFVDALFAKLCTASRQTSKCKTWDELLAKRGYTKRQFDEALAALQTLPDQQKQRADVLVSLSESQNWHSREKMRVEVALTDLARLKLLQGTVSVPAVDWQAIKEISAIAEQQGSTQEEEFQAIVDFLQQELPNETVPRVKALAIYGMIEAWTNQMPV